MRNLNLKTRPALFFFACVFASAGLAESRRTTWAYFDNGSVATDFSGSHLVDKAGNVVKRGAENIAPYQNNVTYHDTGAVMTGRATKESYPGLFEIRDSRFIAPPLYFSVYNPVADWPFELPSGGMFRWIGTDFWGRSGEVTYTIPAVPADGVYRCFVFFKIPDRRGRVTVSDADSRQTEETWIDFVNNTSADNPLAVINDDHMGVLTPSAFVNSLYLPDEFRSSPAERVNYYNVSVHVFELHLQRGVNHIGFSDPVRQWYTSDILGIYLCN